MNTTELSDQKQCTKCVKRKPLYEFGPEKRNRNGKSSWCLDCTRAYHRVRGREKYKNPKTRQRISENNARNARKNPERCIVNRAKYRAKKQGLPFDLSWRDITVPVYCPLLGIKISMGEFDGISGLAIDSSPSLDRIVPELGYVKTNVKVISFLANMIKNKATPDQLKEVANNIDDYIQS